MIATLDGVKQPQNERLLIIDDDRSTRRLLRAVLEREGFEVIEASDGACGVELFARERPALVLLDVVMPVMDGFATCARIRELDHGDGVAVIMLTGAEDLGAIRAAFDAGATDFITKPINWTLLTQRVYYALRSSALNRAVRQNRLREASARCIARLVFWEWSLSTGELRWSDDPGQLLGITDGRRIENEHDFIALIHPEDVARARRVMRLVSEGEQHLEIELRLCLGEGVERLVRLVGERGVKGTDSDLVIGAFQDVTDMRRTENLVDYLALHDELTELGNRRLFLRQVKQALDTGGGDQIVLVGWIDIGRFHRYNEALGEEAGDWLLTRLAHRLSQQLDTREAVARVGGDEFAVMLLDRDLVHAYNRFEALLLGLRQPMQVSQQETVLTFSAGAASHPRHASDAKQLFVLAQDAQQLARSQGRTLALATSPATGEGETRFAQALAIESALHLALDNNEFFLVYQPQFDLASGRICGVESLLRWQHPQWGLMSPAEFVPLLESLDLIGAVGHWVLVEACTQAARWVEAGLALRVGINLSARQFHEPDLCRQIRELLATIDIDPRLIEIELTETLAMQDPQHAVELLSCLREQGIKIALDDFGIGYSALEYLLRFPIDAIKIDRAFVKNVTDDRGSRAIVRAVSVMGETLGFDIIAEGVETLRQCDFVEALGASEIQGYLIGKPMSAAEIESLISTFRRPGSS